MTTQIEQITERIKQAGIVAIARGDFSLEQLLTASEALLTGHVTVVEVTLNSRDALKAIEVLREQLGPRMLVGAGTVRTADQAEAAIAAGAQFLVAPNFDAATVERALARDVLHLPGVFTPTEAQIAFAAGCRVVKLFPADALGPSYLKAIRAPLNDIQFIPTGGISVDNLGEFMRAGAIAVGVGSSLLSKPGQSAEEIVVRASALHAAWEAARG